MIRPDRIKRSSMMKKSLALIEHYDYYMTYTFLMTNDKTACHSKLMFLRIPLHTKGVEIGYIYE